MYSRLRQVPGIRWLIGACFYYSGVVPLLRWWGMRRAQHRERRLMILTYHRACWAGLRGQLRYLRRHYRVLPLEMALAELSSSIASRETPHKAQADRRPLLAVTFDDGYRDNYTHAFALAQELEVPITIFLIPGYLEKGAPFWWLESDRLVRQAGVAEVTLDGRTYRLDDADERKALAQLIDAHARYATSVAEREAFLTTMREVLEVSAQTPETDEDLLSRPLIWTQVHEMATSGWVSFGAHTMHHPVLACLVDEAEVQREVRDARVVLERELGFPVRIFAYPIGQPEHIGEYGRRAVLATGYQWAVSTLCGSNTTQTDRYLLRRIGCEAADHWLILAARLSGVWGFFFRPKSRTILPAVQPIPPEQIPDGKPLSRIQADYAP